MLTLQGAQRLPLMISHKNRRCQGVVPNRNAQRTVKTNRTFDDVNSRPLGRKHSLQYDADRSDSTANALTRRVKGEVKGQMAN